MTSTANTASKSTFNDGDSLEFRCNSFAPVESFRSDSFQSRHLAIVEVRAQLRRAEDILIHEMMTMGASWADIGELFGISRQAAHFKFRDRVGSFGEDD